MSVLERAKRVEREQSDGTNLWIKLSLLQDLIAEIERLETERPLRAITNKLKTEQGGS